MKKGLEHIIKKALCLIMGIVLSSCVPPLPFLEEYCIPPIQESDFAEGGKVRVSSYRSHTIRADGRYDMTTATVTDNQGRSIEISIPSNSSPTIYTSPKVAVAGNTKIKINSIIGQYYKGPSYFTTPEYGNYIWAVTLGEFDTELGKYIGKRFRIKNVINGAEVPITDKDGKQIYVNRNDKVIFTISKADKRYYIDPNKTISFVSTLKPKQNFIDVNNLKNQAKEMGFEGREEDWYLQRVASLIIYKIGALGYKIVGYGRDSGVIQTEEEKNNDQADMVVPYYQTREKTMDVDGYLGLRVNLDPNLDADVDVFVFVQVYKGKVEAKSIPIEMKVINCPSSGGCDPNHGIPNNVEVQTFSNIKEYTEYDISNGGDIWFRIMESPSDIPKLSGYITINYEAATWGSTSNVYMPIIKVIKEKSSMAMTKLYKSLMVNTYLKLIVQLALIVWISIKLSKFVMGIEKITVYEIVVALAKFGIALMFVSESSYEFINTIIFNGLIGIPEAMVRKMDITDLGYSFFERINNTEGIINPFAFMDEILAVLLTPEVFKRFLALLISPGGILVFGALLATMLFILRGFVKAFFIYIFAVMMIRFLLGISPFFAPLIVFENNNIKGVVQSYWNIIFRFAVEPVIMVLGLMVISSIILLLLKSYVLNLQLCFKCVLPIKIDIGPLSYIPLISEIEQALCFWGFMPWGVDNFTSFSSSGNSFDNFSGGNGMMIIMVRYLIPALCMLILAMIFEAYVEFTNMLGQSLGFQFLSGGMGQIGRGGGGGSGALGAAGAFLGGISTVQGLLGKGVRAAAGAIIDRINKKPGADKDGLSPLEKANREAIDIAKKAVDTKTDAANNKINELVTNLADKANINLVKGPDHILKDEWINVLAKDKLGGEIAELVKLREDLGSKLDINDLKEISAQYLNRAELANTKNMLLIKEAMSQLNDIITENVGGGTTQVASISSGIQDSRDYIVEILNKYEQNAIYAKELGQAIHKAETQELERLRFEKAKLETEGGDQEQVAKIAEQIRQAEDSIKFFDNYQKHAEQAQQNVQQYYESFNAALDDVVSKSATISKAEAEDKMTGITDELNTIYNEQEDYQRNTFKLQINDYFDQVEKADKEEDSLTKIEKDIWSFFRSKSGPDDYDESKFESYFESKFTELSQLYGVDDPDTIKEGIKEKAMFAWKLSFGDNEQVQFTAKEQEWKARLSQ